MRTGTGKADTLLTGVSVRFYTAGGAVRDLLLGRPMRDADFVFAGPAEAFILRYPAARKTKEGPHPIYLLNGQEYSPLKPGLPLDEALAADLLRRDFTVNALLLSDEGMLHAHKESLDDLRHRRIRPASPSALRDDPVRVFRAARFAATLPGFTLHEETAAQMRSLGETTPGREALGAIAAEQVGNEVRKACLGDEPGRFLTVLGRGSCLAPWFIEFSLAMTIPAGPPRYHDTDVLEHTARVMNTCAARCRDDGLTDRERGLAVWMALCHDIGKSATPAGLLPSHHGHDASGDIFAGALGRRLRLPALFIKAGSAAARLHMKAGRYHELRPGTKVDLLIPLHNAGLLRPFSRMAAADSGLPDLPERMEKDCERILTVTLPDVWKNRGEASGARLRELRARRLASENGA